MSFHLEGPWLSTTGKKKGPKKWASSEAKAKAEQLAREWRDREREWAKLTPNFSAKNNTARSTVKVEPSRTSPLTNSGPKVPPGRETPQINSVDTGWVACTKSQDQAYTGTKVKGIGTMHKSNAVPIFSDNEAIEISKMRR